MASSGDEVTPPSTGDDVTPPSTGDDVTPPGSDDEMSGDPVTPDEGTDSEPSVVVSDESESVPDLEAEDLERARPRAIPESVSVQIADADAARFWTDMFSASTLSSQYGKVSFEMLAHALEKRFPPTHMQPLLRDRLLYDETTLFHLVRYVIDYAVQTDGVITIDEFNKFVQRFGPFERCVLNCINALFSHRTTLIVEWFWGEYANNRPALERESRNVSDSGRFLVMFPDDDAPHLTLRIHDGSRWRVVDIHNDNGEFHLRGEEPFWRPRLQEHLGEDHSLCFDSLHAIIEELILCGRITMGLESPLFKASKKRAAEISSLAGGLVGETRHDVCVQTQTLRGVIKSYYAASEIYATRETVYWNQLCDRVESAMTDNAKHIDRNIFQLDHELFNLRCDLESAIDLWGRALAGKADLIVFDEEFGVERAHDDFQRLEDAIYTGVVAILEVLFPDKRLVLEEPRPPTRHFDWMERSHNLRVRRLFFFRMFGVDFAETLRWADLGKALEIYLRVEFGRVHIAPRAITQLMLTVSNLPAHRAKTPISKDEWQLFMYRFGPLQHCYDKASAICEVTSPTDDHPQISLARWFRFWERPKTEVALNWHARESRLKARFPQYKPAPFERAHPHTLFYLRHGRGAEHIFSMSFVRRNENKPRKTDALPVRGRPRPPPPQAVWSHTKILACPMPGKPHTAPDRGYHFENNPNCYSDMHGLVEMVVNRLKWSELEQPLKDQNYQWLVMNAHWSNIHSETDQPVHHLMEFNRHLGGYVTKLVADGRISPNDFKPPKKTSGQRIREMLHARDLDAFVRYCSDKDTPIDERRAALASYRKGAIVHEIIRVAVSNSDWTRALEAVRDTFTRRGVLSREGERLFHHAHQINRLTPAEAIVAESFEAVHDAVPSWLSTFDRDAFENALPNDDAVRLLEVFEDSDLLAPEDLFRVLLLSIKHVHLGLFERVIRCASTRVLSRLCSVEDIINPTHAMRLGNNLFHTISALSIPDCSIVEQYQTHFCRRLATFIWSVTADRLTKGDSLRAGRRRSRRASALSSTQQGTTSPWFRLIDARNVAGQTPAMMAAERRRRNLLQFYLHQCEASYDVLDENNNSLFNYILADLDKWLRDDPNEKLLNLLSQSQRLTHTVNHRNRNNQSPLFIVVSKLKHLEDMEKSDSVSGDLTQMLSLKEDVEVLEKLVYKLLASGALMDSLSGHQAKSDELRTYFLNKLISAMADDVEDKDRWLIFESAVRNRDTELVKGILDSKELPYFFCPPDLSGTFDSDINQLSLYATKKEDPALATQPLTRTMKKKKRRANARQSIDFVSGDEDSDDYDAIEQQSTRRRGKSLSSRPVRRVHTFDSANRKRHQAQVVQDEEALLRDDDDNPGDDVDSEDERKHDADDEPLVEAATSSRKVRAATSAATSRSYGTRRSPSAKAPSSSKSPRPRDDSRPSTEDHDEADTAEESVAPLKSILHVAVGLRDQDPQLVDMLLTAAPKPKILDQTSQRIVDEGLKDAAGGEERPRRRECLRPNPDAIDRRGRTALHVVAQLAEPSSRSLEIAKSLLAHIDVLAKDWRGYTALHYAAENGNLELVRLLLEAHAEPSEVSTDGAKLDSYKRACGALRAGERKWVRDSNSVVIKGRTALHLAAKRGHWQVAAELLKDVKVSEDDEDDNSLTDPIDDTGRTPLCLALERRQEMLKYRGRFKEEDANQRRDGKTKSKSGKDKSAQAMSKTAPSVGRSTSKRLALASPTGSVPRSLTDGMASPQQRTARHLRQHSIEMQTVAHDESRMLRPSTLAWKDDMVRHLLPVGVSDPLAVADLKRQSSADSYMHKHRSRSRSQLRSQGSSGLSSRRAMTMMPSSTNVTGPAPSEAPSEGPPPSDAGDPESGYADDTYEAKSRRLKEVHRNHVQMQLIMQMLQDVGEEVLDDRVAQWETSMMVSLEINDYGEIEFKDVSKLERNFDNTVKKLLASGASIEVATNSAGYDLTDLIDIDTQWDSINEDVQRFEREKIYQQITDGALAPMYNQKKQDVFSERQNQIVIDYRYKSQVWNMLAVRLFAYMLFVAAATLLAIQETTKDELSAHFFYESLEQTLVGDEFPHNVSQLLRTYEDIDDKSEFYMWMRGPFLDVFYPEPAVYYAQGDELHRRDLGFINKQARLIGVPRLRQLRSQNTSCDVPYEWRKTGVDLECFTTANEPDTTTFGPDIAGVGPWKYYTESKLKGVQTWGRTGFFGGDGHVIDLPAPVESGSREKMHQLALDLEEYSFIDVKTRAVFLEFSAFDAHENFFAVCHIMLEFPRAGGTVVSSSFNVAPMRRYVDQRDNTWTLYLEVIVVLMLVLYIVNQTGPGAVRFFTQDLWKEPSKEEEEVSNGVEDEHQGKAYMFELTTDTFPFKIREPQVKSPNSCAKAGSACWKSCCTPTKRRWTLARIWLPFRRIFAATMSALSVSITEDGALVNWGLRCSIAAILYLRIVNVAEASDIDWEEQRAYVPVQRLGRFTVVESQAWSVFIFFAWFKLLTFLKVFRALSKLLIMIDFMLADLLDFAILLLIVLIAFASAEYVAYGYADPSSPTWLYSFITRFSYAFSGREIDGRNELNRVLGVIYPMIFVIIVLLLLLNLLIAILTSAYDRARTRAGKSYWARWQYEKIRSENDAPPVLSGAFLLDVITGVYTQCKGPCRRALARIHPDSYLPSGSSGGSSGGSGGRSGGSSDPSRSHSRHQSRGSI